MDLLEGASALETTTQDALPLYDRLEGQHRILYERLGFALGTGIKQQELEHAVLSVLLLRVKDPYLQGEDLVKAVETVAIDIVLPILTGNHEEQQRHFLSTALQYYIHNPSIENDRNALMELGVLNEFGEDPDEGEDTRSEVERFFGVARKRRPSAA